MRFIAFITLGFFLTTLGFADHDSSKRASAEIVKKIFAIQYPHESVAITVRAAFEPLISRIPKPKQSEVQDLINSFADEVAQDPRLYSDLSEVYIKLFTQEELEDLLAFYESPIGRKLVSNYLKLHERVHAVAQKNN